jgi:elongator complex protein 3
MLKLNKFEYEASGGFEIFLSFEDIKRDILIGFLRLRVPSEKILKGSKVEHLIMVRELHIYGPLVKIGEKINPRKMAA